MLSRRILGTIFVTALLMLTLSACGGSGGGGESIVNSEMAGLWVSESDRESIENLKQEDGSCHPTKVSESSDLGDYYLEVIRIENDGRIMSLAVVNKDTMPEGDFYHKWSMDGEGRLSFSDTFKTGWNGQLEVKDYEHKMSLKEEDVIESHLIKSVTVHQGQEWTMEDEKNLFYKIGEQELKEMIEFAKDCAGKQTLAQ